MQEQEQTTEEYVEPELPDIDFFAEDTPDNVETEEQESTEEEESSDEGQEDDAETEEQESTEEEAESSDDEEEDYDTPVKKKKGDDDESEMSESMARQRAKEEGRKRKELEARVTEKDLEVNRLTEENEKLQQQIAGYQSSNIDPTSHPDFRKIKDEVIDDIRSAEELIPGMNGKNSLENRFGDYMKSYLLIQGAANTEEKRQKMAELRGVIVDELGGFSTGYAELFDDEKLKADSLATSVLQVVQRNVGKTRQLQKIADDIVDRASSGRLEQEQGNYVGISDEITSALGAIETLTEELIDEDPHATESVVARMIREDPDQKRRYGKVLRDVTLAFAGPKPLTRKEIDDLETSGKDVKAFMKERQLNYEKHRKKMASYLAQHLMTRSGEKSAREELEGFRKKKKADDDQTDALAGVKGGKGSKTSPKKYENPWDRPLAIDEHDPWKD